MAEGSLIEPPAQVGRADPYAPLATTMLAVGDGHELYVETIGREGATPAVFLHGGPGSGSMPAHRRLFDPERFHAVLFDQRGAGRSRPARSRDTNTTADLIRDLETIRSHFGFERWLLVGGSWGATLALAYAEAHPQRVSGIVLRATFLGTRAELDRAFGVALPTFYPALYADFLAVLPPEERDHPLDNYWRRILDADPAIHGPAAIAWHDTERTLSEAKPGKVRLDGPGQGRAMPGSPFMEAHYFAQDSFLAPDQLIADAGVLAGIRGVIIQGRYDLLCPPQGSYELAARWPDAEIVMVDGAGHSLWDPGVAEAVTAAVRSFATDSGG